MADLQEQLQAALGDAYRVERELGGGGMSRVFVAEEVALGRKVVVKVLPPEMAAGVSADRFSREIRLAASLQHPHVVPLLAAGDVGDVVWYTMPMIEGESLRAKLAREGEQPIPEAVRILRDVADALSYAHRHGLVHRDIKPDNVLISDRHALVTDFGVAKALSAAVGTSTLTSAGLALGTPAYMAPEQAAASPNVDHRADIYAFGAMAYELLAGAPPFAGWAVEVVMAAHVTEAPDPVTRRRPAVPAALAALVMRCLEKKPADRWQSAAELEAALEAMTTPSSGTAPTAIRSPSLADLVMPVGAWWRIAALVVVVVFLAVAGVGMWKRFAPRPGPRPDANLVAVLPFRVAGADPSLHYLRQGMLDLMVAKLTGEGGPRAADARSVLAALRSVADTGDADLPLEVALKVARRVGAGRILEGSIVGPPEHIVISASIVDAAAGREPTQATVEGPKDSLFVLVDRLTAQLLALGAGTGRLELSSATTTSLDALRAYLDGMAAYRSGAFVEAVRLLRRAVELDSTFALAASALLEASGWAPNEDFGRARRLAWRYRDRLSERHRLLLTVRLQGGEGEPRPEALANIERVTQALPESPEAWYHLGDALFHTGLLLGLGDAPARAEAAFRRALDRDSLFFPALTHLASLAALRHDSAELGRLVPRILAIDSSGRQTLLAWWDLAAARHDERAIAAVAARLDSEDVDFVLSLAAQVSEDSVGHVHQERLFEAVRRRATTSDDRAHLALHRWTHALDLGRPREAGAWLDSMIANGWSADYNAILAWPWWDGDSVGVDSAAHRQALLAVGPPGPGRRRGLFLTEVWKLSRGDVSSVDRTVQRLRTDPTVADTVAQRNLLFAQVLEAWAAVVRQSPRARGALDAADSMVLGRFAAEDLAMMIANLYARLGATDRALAAIRRRFLPATHRPRAEQVRLEGLWAAQSGDRAGAVAAYRTYLMYRTDPEPSKLPQRDSVRAELERLERGR